MPKVGDVTLIDESFDRFLTMAEQGATTVYSVAGVTFRMDALRSITADGRARSPSSRSPPTRTTRVFSLQLQTKGFFKTTRFTKLRTIESTPTENRRACAPW